MTRIREFGSDFHYPLDKRFNLNSPIDYSRWFNKLCASGRVALSLIIQHGINKHRWKKLYVPSYYCLEVYNFIHELTIELVFYEANPLTGVNTIDCPDEKENAVLVVDFFGLNKVNYPRYVNASVIADLTHNLSAIQSCQATYKFGSLRKCLPIPLGGFITSTEDILVSGSSDESNAIYLSKVTAMGMKYQYLHGNILEKDTFRLLFQQGEEAISNPLTMGGMPQPVQSMLAYLDIDGLLYAKRRNIAHFKHLIHENSIFELVSYSDQQSSALDNEISLSEHQEFSAILHFKEVTLRDKLKHFLINHQIYSMVLWPNQNGKVNSDLESKLLFIHLDYRYDVNDVKFICECINQFLKDNG